MKCPKCGYLGFERVDRCRNCGYDFSLAPAAPLPELPLRDSAQPAPLEDLALLEAAAPPAPAAPAFSTEVAPQDLDRTVGAAPTPGTPVAPSTELPLFGGPVEDDEPLIKRVSPPRPPLAVRRATPEVPRLRAEPRPVSLDLDLAESAPALEVTPTPSAEREAVALPEVPAGIGARLAAVLIDLLILAATDAIVVYFTMQICGLALADLHVLPKGPLLAFLVVQNGGYLVSFTAGGQTLGKMAAGVRVVPATPELTLDLGRAMVRELVWAILAIPAGLGFVSALFSEDRRGLHDRFAGTRVVRASA